MSGTLRLIGTLIMSCSLLMQGAAAQNVTEIRAAPSCPRCRILLQSIATLRAPSQVQLMEFSSVVRDSRGQYFVGPTYEPGQIAIFSPSGAFVRTIGHQGGGPGEFQEIRRLYVGPGDSLFVSHDFRRFSVFAPDLQFKRSWLLKTESFSPGAFMILGSNRMLASRWGGLGGSIDHPLRTFQLDGSPELGFGPQSRFSGTRRYVGVAVMDSQIWAGVQQRYEIDVFHIAGGGQPSTLRRNVVWFPPPQTPPNPGPPAGLLADIAVSSSSVLWVLVSVAKPNATLPPRPPRGAEVAESRLSASQYQAMREFMLEAIDIKAGTAVATLKLDAVVGGFIGFDQIYVFREDADGNVTIEVSRLRLQR